MRSATGPSPISTAPTPDRTRLLVLREARRLVRDSTLAFLACVGALALFFQPFKVEGTSMEPRLEADERILVNRVVYRLEPVPRGDVVVFGYPGDPSRSFVKRVIGLPGEVVEIRGGVVWVDGTALPEPYLAGVDPAGDDFGPVRVQPQHYFVLGDHRSVSNDSRAWGMVPERLIRGKAFLRYWPLTRAGTID